MEEEEEAQFCLSAPGAASGRGSEGRGREASEGRGEGRGSEVECDDGLECQCGVSSEGMR